MSEATQPDQKLIMRTAVTNCEVALSVVGKEPLLVGNAQALLECKDWLFAMRNQIAGSLENLLQEEAKKNEVAPQPS